MPGRRIVGVKVSKQPSDLLFFYYEAAFFWISPNPENCLGPNAGFSFSDWNMWLRKWTYISCILLQNNSSLRLSLIVLSSVDQPVNLTLIVKVTCFAPLQGKFWCSYPWSTVMSTKAWRTFYPQSLTVSKCGRESNYGIRTLEVLFQTEWQSLVLFLPFHGFSAGCETWSNAKTGGSMSLWGFKSSSQGQFLPLSAAGRSGCGMLSRFSITKSACMPSCFPQWWYWTKARNCKKASIKCFFFS